MSRTRRDIGRPGFTLVEIVVAMAIMLIVSVALVASFAAYYGRTTQARLATIGQNLAQLQLEDSLSMDKGVLADLVYGGDPLDVNYINSDPRYRLIENVSTASGVYDSGKVDGRFYITGVNEVNVPSMNISHYSPSSAGDVPDLDLPSGLVDIEAVDHPSAGTWDYTVTLNKAVFPGYERRVVITDTTPLTVEAAYKVFQVDVTVYWTAAGVEQNYTLSAEK